MAIDHLQEVIKLREKQPLSIGLLVEQQAAARESAPMLIFEGRTVTYGEFNRQANRYAHLLASRGVKKGDVVALLMDNRPEYLIAACGISKLGAVASLINNGVRKDVLAHALSICNASYLIIGQELLAAYAEISDQVKMKAPAEIYLQAETAIGKVSHPARIIYLNPLLETMSDTNPAATAEVNSEDVAVYIYTSGTTGYPKATAVLQKRWLILGHLMAMLGQMDETKVQYMCLPLYHNSGFDIAFAGLIVTGSCMVLRRKFSASNFWKEVRTYNCTHFVYVGELCRYIYNQPPQPDDHDNPLEYVSGNGMRGDIMLPFKERFGVKNLIEVYGATEGVGSFINFETIPGMCGNLSLGPQRQGEIVRYDFVNDEILRDAAGFAQKAEAGETGLLLCEINDLNRFAGYVNNPEATGAKIMHNIFREGDQYFNSGDLVQLHEHDYFSFVDRLGDTFRWKSENVSTNQVADTLIKFGGIEDANVFGVQVPGYEGRCGMVALKLLEGAEFEPQRFAAYVEEHLPAYARPCFVRLRQELDITNSFKRVKSQLQKQGYNLSLVNDPLYFLDAETNSYIPLNQEICAAIDQGEIKL
ncbi:MAG: long-chain-acyl-CoA synthetase [Methylocystaceae bacterium]